MENIYNYIGESLDIMALVILLIICAAPPYMSGPAACSTIFCVWA